MTTGWHGVLSGVSQTGVSDALKVAVGSVRVIPALYDELKKRAISIERIAG